MTRYQPIVTITLGLVLIFCFVAKPRKLQGEFLGSYFCHGSWPHLLRAMVALLLVARLELERGSLFFLAVLCAVYLVSVTFEFVATRVLPKAPTSIGMTGVLVGVAIAASLASRKIFDLNLALAVLVLVLTPNLLSERASLTGMLSGALAGILVGLVMIPFSPSSSSSAEVMHPPLAVGNPLDLPGVVSVRER